MREKKFTAVPWELAPYTDECVEIDIVHGYKFVNGRHQADWIANLQEENVNGGFDVMEANANLIAAAPELLEACEMLIEIINAAAQAIRDGKEMRIDGLSEKEVKIESALAKAYGE